MLGLGVLVCPTGGVRVEPWGGGEAVEGCRWGVGRHWGVLQHGLLGSFTNRQYGGMLGYTGHLWREQRSEHSVSSGVTNFKPTNK